MTEEWKTLASVASQDVVDALTSAYKMGLNAGLANKLTEGTFEWAMQQMRQGRRVKRKDHCFEMHINGINGRLLAVATGRAISTVGIDLEHVGATDWEIVPEPKPELEGHDFAWAIKQIKNGKRVRRKAWGVTWWIGGKNGSVNIGDACECDWILAPEGEQPR